MALSVKASFTAISIPLSTPPRWFKHTEGKNTLSLKNQLRVAFFFVFLICAAKPKAVGSYRTRTDKLAYTGLARWLTTIAHGASSTNQGHLGFLFQQKQKNNACNDFLGLKSRCFCH
jgi:hypothetical protein